MFCLDLQLEVSNLTLNGIPTGKDSKDVTVFQHKTGKSSLARGEFRRERGEGGGGEGDDGMHASLFSNLLLKK